ncbi:OmpA/MotB domain protein [Fibrella aestuarina BUZ 2]|uniref:OmpA/MotB domain protein n=2 Tax=Fibrella TaxID=861914 RepID=I0KA40_9BACT|nr:OmpA/MotB domain protein [Fibrella aestuarina BUZ 2]
MHNARCTMSKHVNWLSILFIVYCTLYIVHSSPAQSKRAQDLYQQGVTLFRERKPNEAIPFFQQAVKESPTYLDAHMQLGMAYEYTRKPEQALGAYKQIIALQPNPAVAGQAYQQTASILLRLGRYAEAIPVLEAYSHNFAPQSSKAKQIQRGLATARFGMDALAHPVSVQPKPLAESLNVGQSQYFPVLTADEQTIVFTMLKPEGDEDLMTANQASEGGWQAPTPLSANISTPDNEGTATLSADGRLLVFTACQSSGTRQGFGSCDLFSSQKTGDAWSVPQNLGPVINTRYYESQPSLSADGRQLYFISDRPGGIGKRDIWRSDRDAQGNWGEPVNLGQPVNTVFDEASPFMHANGQALFFASDGHPGMGGYDLFLSRFRPDSLRAGWSVPQNLGYPINSSEDQASLFVSANGSKAYYSFEEQKDGVSQRSRIYTFDLPTALREQVRPVNYLKGLVTDARSRKPLNASIDLIDVRTNQVVSRVKTDEQTGQYVAVLPAGGEYALYVSAPGYLFKSLAFNYTDKLTTETGMGKGMALDATLEPISNTSKETLNNLFFESGRYELSTKSRTELERLAEFLKVNPTTKIEIAGHTDDRGEAAANLELSRRRAAAVVGYLAQMGIDPARMKSVGYGKTRPAVAGTSDEARQRNRRIEWRVL